MGLVTIKAGRHCEAPDKPHSDQLCSEVQLMTQHWRNRNKPAVEGSHLHPELAKEPQNETRSAKGLAFVKHGPKKLFRAVSNPEQLRPCNHLQCFCEWGDRASSIHEVYLLLEQKTTSYEGAGIVRVTCGWIVQCSPLLLMFSDCYFFFPMLFLVQLKGLSWQ